MNNFLWGSIAFAVIGVGILVWGWVSATRATNPDDWGGAVGGIVGLVICLIVSFILFVIGMLLKM